MTYHLKLPNFSNHQLNFAIRICYFYTKNQIYTSLSIITFFQLFLKFFAYLISKLCFNFEKVKAHLSKIIDHICSIKFFLIFMKNFVS